MMAKPMKTLELHYPMIQFLIIINRHVCMLANMEAVGKFRVLGPVQTSCFCRAELNSEIKFDKSTAEARRLNQTYELSSARWSTRKPLLL